MLVSVEGNIGSGKTYFLDILKGNSQFLIVDEPWLQVQDLLVNFYTDPYSWAFPLQLAMLTKRAHNHMRIQNSSDNIVVERTIQSDRFIFAENNRLRGYMSEKITFILSTILFFIILSLSYKDKNQVNFSVLELK